MGVTVCRNGTEERRGAREAGNLKGNLKGDLRRDPGGDHMGAGESQTILLAEDYAARLDVSPAVFAQAMKLKRLESRGEEPKHGSPLDRPGLRRLAARIAPPTRRVPNRHPIYAWWIGDIERFEAEETGPGAEG